MSAKFNVFSQTVQLLTAAPHVVLGILTIGQDFYRAGGVQLRNQVMKTTPKVFQPPAKYNQIQHRGQPHFVQTECSCQNKKKYAQKMWRLDFVKVGERKMEWGGNEKWCGGEDCGGRRWGVWAGSCREWWLGSDWWWLGGVHESWRIDGVKGDFVGQVKVMGKKGKSDLNRSREILPSRTNDRPCAMVSVWLRERMFVLGWAHGEVANDRSGWANVRFLSVFSTMVRVSANDRPRVSECLLPQ